VAACLFCRAGRHFPLTLAPGTCALGPPASGLVALQGQPAKLPEQDLGAGSDTPAGAGAAPSGWPPAAGAPAQGSAARPQAQQLACSPRRRALNAFPSNELNRSTYTQEQSQKRKRGPTISTKIKIRGT